MKIISPFQTLTHTVNITIAAHETILKGIIAGPPSHVQTRGRADTWLLASSARYKTGIFVSTFINNQSKEEVEVRTPLVIQANESDPSKSYYPKVARRCKAWIEPA
jgi:hypothetical protein